MKKNDFFYLAVIVALTFAAYANTLDNDFVWDDHFFVFREEVKGFDDIGSFFIHDTEGVYRPFREVLYVFAYAMFGENAFFYHLMSTILHIGISIVVFFFVRTLTEKRLLAFLTALFFGLHPVHTEAVSFITSSFDNFGVLFMFLSLFFYVDSRKLLSLLFFVLGVFSYEPVVVMPWLIVLIDLFKGESLKTKIKAYTPYFIITGIFIFIRFFLIGVISRSEPLGASYLLTLLTMPFVFVRYVLLLLVPFGLSVNHEVIFAHGLFEFWVLFPIVCLIGLAAFGIYMLNRNNIVFFVVSWLLITLLPFSNILPLQRLIAEVYLYIPSFGFCLLLAFVLIRFRRKTGNILFIFIVIFLAFGCLALTVKRNNDWQDDLSLWTATVKTSPNSSKAHNNLAVEYEKLGEMDRAIEEYLTSIKLNPKRVNPYISLGAVYYKLGNYTLAKQYWGAAVELDPSQDKIRNNLRILQEQGY